MMLRPTDNVRLWRLHGCVLDFIHLSVTGMAEIAESTNLKVCPHTFVYIGEERYSLRPQRVEDTVHYSSTDKH